MYEIEGERRRWWRCLNAAWGCNWMVRIDPEDDTARPDPAWCRSCALTRGRPDVGRPEAVEAWAVAEAAKRRLVYQLDGLGLPIEARSAANPRGLAFDLVHVPGVRGITGHAGGVVTLDLAEADDLHRHRLRRELDEPYRTVIGHLRHEIGHFYWHRLVGESNDLVEFRRLFGDERADYATALERHYGRSTETPPAEHVSAYAAAHPLEDWAETFAHYLHVLDGLDTAASHGLVAGHRSIDPAGLDVEHLLDLWEPVVDAVNDIARSLGVAEVFPFTYSDAVVVKLGFVHAQVSGNASRRRFYAVRGAEG